MGAEKVLVVISFCGSGVLGPLQFLKRKVVYFMAGFLCPYCSNMMSVSEDTHSRRYPSFSSAAGKDIYWNGEQYMNEASCLEMDFYQCPNCGEYTIRLSGIGDGVKDITKMNIRPRSLAKQYPDYIPQNIRNDYEEACAIVDLSPKASATLSRRCLQGIIRDFWGVNKKTLYEEIDAIKDKIPLDLWKSIDALRQLGNIGAHMEKDTNTIVDIEPNEASSLIRLIELLMKEWYINREERRQLFSNIISSNDQKQAQRTKTE